jgi:hypothetical protein
VRLWSGTYILLFFELLPAHAGGGLQCGEASRVPRRRVERPVHLQPHQSASLSAQWLDISAARHCVEWTGRYNPQPNTQHGVESQGAMGSQSGSDGRMLGSHHAIVGPRVCPVCIAPPTATRPLLFLVRLVLPHRCCVCLALSPEQCTRSAGTTHALVRYQCALTARPASWIAAEGDGSGSSRVRAIGGSIDAPVTSSICSKTVAYERTGTFGTSRWSRRSRSTNQTSVTASLHRPTTPRGSACLGREASGCGSGG